MVKWSRALVIAIALVVIAIGAFVLHNVAATLPPSVTTALSYQQLPSQNSYDASKNPNRISTVQQPDITVKNDPPFYIENTVLKDGVLTFDAVIRESINATKGGKNATLDKAGKTYAKIAVVDIASKTLGIRTLKLNDSEKAKDMNVKGSSYEVKIDAKDLKDGYRQKVEIEYTGGENFKIKWGYNSSEVQITQSTHWMMTSGTFNWTIEGSSKGGYIRYAYNGTEQVYSNDHTGSHIAFYDNDGGVGIFGYHTMSGVSCSPRMNTPALGEVECRNSNFPNYYVIYRVLPSRSFIDFRYHYTGTGGLYMDFWSTQTQIGLAGLQPSDSYVYESGAGSSLNVEFDAGNWISNYVDSGSSATVYAWDGKAEGVNAEKMSWWRPRSSAGLWFGTTFPKGPVELYGRIGLLEKPDQSIAGYWNQGKKFWSVRNSTQSITNTTGGCARDWSGDTQQCSADGSNVLQVTVTPNANVTDNWYMVNLTGSMTDLYACNNTNSLKFHITNSSGSWSDTSEHAVYTAPTPVLVFHDTPAGAADTIKVRTTDCSGGGAADPATIYLAINTAESDSNHTYDNIADNITAWSNVTGLTVNVLRNGSAVTNPLLQPHAAGAYNFTAYVNNASYNATPVTRFLTIAQAASTTELWLNNSAANLTVTYPTATNATGAVITPAGGNGILHRKGTDMSTNSLCLQEFANISTVCGGLNSGFYNFTGDWSNQSALIDGNWTSEAHWITASPAGMNVVFYKPVNSIGAKMRFKDGASDANYTLPTECWDAFGSYIQFQIGSATLLGQDRVYLDCFKAPAQISASFHHIGMDVTSVYELAIYWINDTVENPDIQTLPVGTYNYTFVYPSSQNYSTSSITRWLTVNPPPGLDLRLALNGVEGNATGDYPFAVNVTAWTNVTGVVPDVFLDGTLISNPKNVSLAAGTYNVTVASNYSYSWTPVTRYIIVNQGPVALHLAFNGTEADTSHAYGTVDNATAWSNITGLSLVLTKNGTAIGNPFLLRHGIGVYNYTVFFSNPNYTASPLTRYLTVTQANSGLALASSAGWTIMDASSTTVTCTATSGPVTFTKGGVGIGSPYTALLSVGAYSFACTLGGDTANYTPTSASNTLNVVTSNAGCTGTGNYAYTATVSAGADQVALDFTSLVNSGLVRHDLGDVYLSTANVTVQKMVNATNYFVLVNSTLASPFTLRFGNYYVAQAIPDGAKTNGTDTAFSYSQYSANYYTFSLTDEVLGSPLLPPSANNSVMLTCANGTSIFSVTNTTNFTVATNSPVSLATFTASYSASDFYYRQLVIRNPIEERTFYLVDATKHSVLQNIITVDDRTGMFKIGAVVKVKELLANGLQTVTESPLDIELKMVAFVLNGGTYQIFLDNGVTERSVGNIYADPTRLSKNIVLNQISTTDVLRGNITYGINMTQGLLRFIYNDPTGTTDSVELWVYNYTTHGQLYYTSSQNHSSTIFTYAAADPNGTYTVKWLIHSLTYGNNTLGGSQNFGNFNVLTIGLPFALLIKSLAGNDAPTAVFWLVMLFVLPIPMFLSKWNVTAAGAMMLGMTGLLTYWKIIPMSAEQQALVFGVGILMVILIGAAEMRRGNG